MGILDSFKRSEEAPTAIDVLFQLLDKNNIEMKTDLNISQIKILFQSKFFTEMLKEENKDKDPYTIFQECIEYFLKLMTSLKRESRKEIIKGVSEMKDRLLEQTLLMNSGLPIGGAGRR